MASIRLGSYEKENDKPEKHIVKFRDGEWDLYGTVDKSKEVDLNKYKIFMWERWENHILGWKISKYSNHNVDPDKFHYSTQKGRAHDIKKLRKIFKKDGLFSRKTRGFGLWKKEIWIRTKCRLDLKGD